MSCEVECIASGVQCMGQLAVEVGAGAPEGRGRRGKGRVRAHGRQGEGPWCVCVCGALLLELVLALVLRCCRARHTLNCVVDPCVGSGAQGRRPNCAGHAARVGAGVSGG